ncbi:hypothetical protein [Leifsonia shinshuensis]|uniref:hypothetical protein n=1 Tax=Leifsonia shinshuensis TaxID=150026 RepID=UPI002854AC68|nr:hypothetical protein [Leifsonia shinshuensis]MDR6972704.1 hypothetical protein [Leifsonia shinshuensis]
MNHSTADDRDFDTARLASAILVRHNELAVSLAAHANGLLQAAEISDEVAARRHRRAVGEWFRDRLDPALEEATGAAMGMIASGAPDSGVAILGRVVALRHAASDLESATCARDAAMEVIQLRVQLHQLLRILEMESVTRLLTQLRPGPVQLRPPC